ncbi:hypothetical protein Dd586_3120 [Dickeya parazeae Ech586]|uniref:Uncharacterized protein n=1 Tax=Dickeya zeae (strain Ech586) TaxID=590409 RepID=D2BUA8_DICZ5|nr:hypothetical protein Dd586_3120 [Dickeya parazeae Ech586]
MLRDIRNVEKRREQNCAMLPDSNLNAGSHLHNIVCI